MNSNKQKLSPEQREALLKTLKARFEKNILKNGEYLDELVYAIRKK